MKTIQTPIQQVRRGDSRPPQAAREPSLPKVTEQLNQTIMTRDQLRLDVRATERASFTEYHITGTVLCAMETMKAAPAMLPITHPASPTRCCQRVRSTGIRNRGTVEADRTTCVSPPRRGSSEASRSRRWKPSAERAISTMAMPYRASVAAPAKWPPGTTAVVRSARSSPNHPGPD